MMIRITALSGDADAGIDISFPAEDMHDTFDWAHIEQIIT